MDNFWHKLPFIFSYLILTTTCVSQHEEQVHDNQSLIINRPPAVAGQFYPANQSQLLQTIKELYDVAEPKKIENVQALVVPHAGYVYSGKVAASGFNQVDFKQEIKNVFILASSHRAYYKGASIYYPGNYLTPLGEVKVNQEIINKLFSESKNISYVPKAHESEHSLEVQLPFLQYKMGEKLRIVPIVIGTQSTQECEEIAEALKPWFTPENLFVVSSDFSHYPSYDEAKKWDAKTADAIIKNSTSELIKVVQDKSDDHVDNLSTRICGWSSLLTLLYLTEGHSEYSYQKILYQNSGDMDHGDKSKVVGYHAIAVSRNDMEDQSFQLSEQDKSQLLSIARKTIRSWLTNKELPILDEQKFSDNLKQNCGAFVTLNMNHNLRGCIGRFTSNEPLYTVVGQMAVASATEDRRFMPVNTSELKEIEIEISVLTPLKRIESIDEIELGKHGIYLKKGYQTGTFLPQVATETGWDLEEFLGHCARDKAGIGWDGWKQAEIYIYEALVFSE